MRYIKEAKMSLENEIDDISGIKVGMNVLNNESFKNSR